MNDLCQVDRNISDFMTQIAELIQTINTQFAKDLPTGPETEVFPEEKIATPEQRAIEMLITNPLAKERVFYRLNE